MEQDSEVPLQFEETAPDAALPSGPVIRENVDPGVKVIDLSAMRAELEASRSRPPGSGGG